MNVRYTLDSDLIAGMNDLMVDLYSLMMLSEWNDVLGTHSPVGVT